MDIRIAAGTAALVLLLLPVGFQLYNSTALTPVGVAPSVKRSDDSVADLRTRDEESRLAAIPQDRIVNYWSNARILEWARGSWDR